jgi:hypothetical protein
MILTWQRVVLACAVAALVAVLALLHQLPDGAAMLVLGGVLGMLVPSRYDRARVAEEITDPATPIAKRKAGDS